MAKMVRIRTVCDGCTADGRGDNDVDTATYGPVEGRTVDLCPEHRATLWDPLVEFVRTHGEPVGKVRKRTTASVARVVRAVPDNHHTAPQPVAGMADKVNKKTRRAGRKERARRDAVAAQVSPEVSSSDVPTPISMAHPCPLCAKVMASTNALQVHLNTQHGTTAGEVFGGTCPVCNHEGTPTGLGTHARMAHGVDGGVPALFREAVRRGDPYGVMAARAEVVARMLGATG